MIPTPYTVLVRSSALDGEDAHGNPTSTPGAPREWAVHAIAPGASEEPRKPNRDLSEIQHTIYAPAKDVPHERDQISLPWEDTPDGPVWYEIEGRPDDWTMGPWRNPIAGVVVELRRTEG